SGARMRPGPSWRVSAGNGAWPARRSPVAPRKKIRRALFDPRPDRNEAGEGPWAATVAAGPRGRQGQEALMLGLFHRFAKSFRPAPGPGRQFGFRPEVEGLGGSTSAGGDRRLPVRPEVEQLEERRVMSSSGVISAITDNGGQTAVFALGTDQHVYEYSPTQT